ncbi:MAG: hypothetical protein ACR2GA_06940 [Chloroflexota bacterium]
MAKSSADLINAGTKVAILAGRGCLDARYEVTQLAEVVGGSIVKPLLGKAIVNPNERRGRKRARPSR